MSSVSAIKQVDFEREVLGSDIPVLVDFWAPWCPPCRAIAPAVDSVAAQFAGKAKVYKLDIDEEPAISDQYGVQSIPTLIIFKNGRPVDQIVGAVPATAIAAKLEAALV